MGFDLFQSRANYNEPCKWWARDERDKNTPDNLIMQRVPSGTFMAQEVAPENMQDAILGGAFMVDRTTVTIKSSDDLKNIKSEYLVEYQGEKWRVVNVQKTKAKRQNTFFAEDRVCSHFWYLELRK